MTPKGVEHAFVACFLASIYCVKPSMTPKGVEHEWTTLASILGSWGETFHDAERR